MLILCFYFFLISEYDFVKQNPALPPSKVCNITEEFSERCAGSIVHLPGSCNVVMCRPCSTQCSGIDESMFVHI